MRRDARFISASEIGTWCYCKKAWHLCQSGYPSANREQRAGGIRYHSDHNRHLRAARRQQEASRIVMFVCVLLLFMLGVSRLWNQ